MKTTIRLIALLAVTMLLAACSLLQANNPSSTPRIITPTPSAAVTPSVSTASPTVALTSSVNTPTPVPTPTLTPIPLPKLNIVPDLPDPGKWAASLHLDPKDYPRIDGSTATLPLAIYMRTKITGASLSDSTALTHFTTTGPSWIALASGTADLLVVYEAPNEVKTELDGMGAKLLKKPIGLDALVFLTNKGNSVNDLTDKQIIDIYTGKITKWSQVGGENTSIIPYQRVSNSGSQALMLKLVMKGVKMMDAPAILQPAEMGELVDAVASYDNTKNALGYSVYYYVRNMYQVPGIKLLSVNGVVPESKTIASGKYPYINSFYAVIREDEPAGSPARKLFDWLTGAEGKRAVEDAGYVGTN